MTYIIAEVGSNFRNFDEAKDSVAMAKSVGANAVKFQMLNRTELYGFENTEHPKELGVSPDWIPALKEKAAACGIDFLCTGFSPEGLRYLDKYVVNHKIASCEMAWPQLLEAAKATGKHIYLSVGAASWGDIARALKVTGTRNTTVMYCSVEYPSRWHNLRLINTIREKFGVNVGFSDHSIDVYTPVTAVHIHGATVIEKHFKIRDMVTPDSGHSLYPEEFQYMVELIRDRNAVMKMPNPGERRAVLVYKRRLSATRDIAAGETFEYGKNFGTYRHTKDDTHGLSGFDWELVNGKTAKHALKQGTAIGPGDF